MRSGVFCCRCGRRASVRRASWSRGDGDVPVGPAPVGTRRHRSAVRAGGGRVRRARHHGPAACRQDGRSPGRVNGRNNGRSKRLGTRRLATEPLATEPLGEGPLGKDRLAKTGWQQLLGRSCLAVAARLGPLGSGGAARGVAKGASLRMVAKSAAPPRRRAWTLRWWGCIAPVCGGPASLPGAGGRRVITARAERDPAGPRRWRSGAKRRAAKCQCGL